MGASERSSMIGVMRTSALVEVVVPVYNEEAVLEPNVRRLRSYLDRQFPLPALVTVADNASTDGTWKQACQLASELDGVKGELAAGRPVIIPLMTHGAPGGARIAPFYGASNVYHVLLITGYRGTTLYTNDAGFTQGQNWAYDWSLLESAMDAQRVKLGQGRVMLSFRPAS